MGPTSRLLVLAACGQHAGHAYAMQQSAGHRSTIGGVKVHSVSVHLGFRKY